MEREATHRAISLAEVMRVPILLVHVSAADAIEQIRWAHGRGLRIYGETCPQYLFLTEDDLALEAGGARCICSPPPRDQANQQLVWDGLANGAFEVLSSDHAPFRSGADGKAVGSDADMVVWQGEPGQGEVCDRVGRGQFVSAALSPLAQVPSRPGARHHWLPKG